MALKLYERYPQLWESPSNDYPQGAFKNLSAQGETDGSYLEQDWLNDYSGFFGALLRNAEMSPNGEVDTAKKSQFYDALVTVAKKAVGEEGYRKLDDNVFNGYLQMRSEHEGQGTGVFLQDTDGTVRGQVVATDQGLQLTQYPKDRGVQTFTFPNEGGEVVTGAEKFVLNSELDQKLGRTQIQDDMHYLFSLFEQGYGVGDVVYTGASTSFNGFGYPPEWGVNGAGWADEQPFGLQSHSHMLRDNLIRLNRYFVPVVECDIRGVSQSVEYNHAINTGMAMKCVSYQGELDIVCPHTSDNLLIIQGCNNPESPLYCEFTLNGKVHNNLLDSNSDMYRGYNYKYINIGGMGVAKITVTTGELLVYGITRYLDKFQRYTHITGKGAMPVSEMVLNYDRMIGKFNPRMLFLYTGGNDIGQDVSSFKTNLKNIVDRFKGENPHGVVCLLGTTPHKDLQETPLLELNNAVHEVAYETSSSFIDIYNILKDLNFDWAIDSVHYNSKGDDYILSKYISLLFPKGFKNEIYRGSWSSADTFNRRKRSNFDRFHAIGDHLPGYSDPLFQYALDSSGWCIINLDSLQGGLKIVDITPYSDSPDNISFNTIIMSGNKMRIVLVVNNEPTSFNTRPMPMRVTYR